MKKLVIVFIGMMLTLASLAQFSPGTGKANATPPQIGRVFGKVTDNSGKSINGASVILMQQKFDSATQKKKDVLIKAMTTKANGEFNVEDLPIMGALTLKISATGFTPVSQPISFQPKMPSGGMTQGGAPDPSKGMPDFSAMAGAFEKDLGSVKMKDDIKQLETVVITGSKPMLKMDIDKKVFNVEKNLVSAGGTALDVMRNVPSLQVDIDGNVKLRNSPPQIFVDGRPTTLQLDQIPADAIESVEVITNPSAKYDASGGNAGILNIVLKKNKKSGYNGNVMAGVDRMGGVNSGGSFSFRQDKINVTASVMANQMRNKSTGNTGRLNFADDPITAITQDNINRTTGGFMFGRLGMDYFITNKTTLSVSGIKVRGKFKPEENIQTQTDSILNTGKVTTYSERLSNSTRTFNATGFQLGMKHLFPKQGEELTADINFFGAKNESDALYTTNYLENKELITGTQQQNVLGDGKNSFLTIQTDYVKPLKGNLKIETGLRAQLRTTESNNTTYIKGIGEPDFVLIPSATNNFKNKDNVYAAYISAKNTIKNFGYQVGLRAESSNYQGELTNTGEEFSNKYPLSLFPSIFLSQKLKNKQELQLSVTRRINRPNFFQLIPYVDYTDSLNITQGNPNLKPEFTSSAEASYSKSFKGNHTLLATVYFKYTNDMITRFLKEDTNPVTGEKDIINTYINANSGYITGLELTSVNPLTKWWDMTSNVNIYNSKINTDNLTEISQDAIWSWFGKLNNTFRLPKNYTIQLTADYQSKTNIPVNSGGGGFGPPMNQAQAASQGYIKAFWGMDIAFKKSFMKNNAATLTLGITDIFKTRYNSQYSYSPYFIQDYTRIMNPQMVRLNFSYRFGKIDMSLFKRQNMKSQAEGMQGGMQGIQ